MEGQEDEKHQAGIPSNVPVYIGFMLFVGTVVVIIHLSAFVGCYYYLLSKIKCFYLLVFMCISKNVWLGQCFKIWCYCVF